MVGPRCDCLDVAPTRYVQLTMDVIACRNTSTVGLQSDGVARACSDRDDVGPAGDVALTRAVVSCRDACAVGSDANSVPVACGDGHDIFQLDTLHSPE